MPMSMVWNEGTLAVLLIFGLPVVGCVAYFWYRIAKVTSDNELKRTMIERGMSVEEIERVLAARSRDK